MVLAEEGPVELDVVGLERLEQSDVGVAGAVVVDRDLRGQLGHAVEDLERLLVVREEHGLEDLDDESREAVRLGELVEDVGEVPVLELRHRHVERDVQVGMAGRPDGAHVLADEGHGEHPEGTDLAALLAERHERVSRPDGAVPLPAHEGLDPPHRSGARIDDRLVVHDELAVLDRCGDLVPALHGARPLPRSWTRRSRRTRRRTDA